MADCLFGRGLRAYAVRSCCLHPAAPFDDGEAVRSKEEGRASGRNCPSNAGRSAMASEHDYWAYVSDMDMGALTQRFVSLQSGGPLDDFPSCDPGRAFEYLIVRAFQLDLTLRAWPGAKVVWPYLVRESQLLGSAGSGRPVEQLDGGLHLPGLSCLFEAKCGRPADVEPIAKLLSQILRRPTGVLGCLFSLHGYTPAAEALARYLAPYTVLLWDADDTTWSLGHSEGGGFVEALLWKRRQAVEYGSPYVKLETRHAYADDPSGLADRVPEE